MTLPAKKRPRGRPPKAAAERKRGVLSMRVRDEMRAELSRLAAAHQRSISEEAEFLLETALRSPGLLDEALDLAFGRQLSGLVLLLARLAHGVADWRAISPDPLSRGTALGRPGSSALNDPYFFDQIAKAITRVFDVLRPAGEIEEPPFVVHLRACGHGENIGNLLANGMLAVVACDAGAAPIRDRLGSDVVRRIAERLEGSAWLGDISAPAARTHGN